MNICEKHGTALSQVAEGCLNCEATGIVLEDKTCPACDGTGELTAEWCADCGAEVEK